MNLSRDDYREYAETCFEKFGDRVKHWMTLNEPFAYSFGGYAASVLAPFRCSDWQHMNCSGGNSATEPYLVSHNLLLAHAAAVRLYKRKFQATQKGIIGITMVSIWTIPYSTAKHDEDAAERAFDFINGWSVIN